MAPRLRMIGRAEYASTADAMRAFTDDRRARTPDEIWLCEHSPVYTQGIAGKSEHVLDAQGIPVLHTNRGGQVTYHGLGQVVAYPLIDLRRLSMHVKEYVYRLEHGVLKVLESYRVTGHRVRGAPGVYVRLADPFGHASLSEAAQVCERFHGLGKIAAVGVKITRYCAYHGVALNVAMDLRPFTRINPCGHAGLEVVDLARLGVVTDWSEVASRLGERLAAQFTP